MEEVLELETRRRIFELISKFPGLHMREIHRRLSLDVTLVKYHLDFMESKGIVTPIQDGAYKRYYPKEPTTGRELIGAKEKRYIAILRRKVPLHIVLLLLARGRSRSSDILEDVSVAPSTLSFHLKKLLKAGVVAKEESGKEANYRVVDPDAIVDLLIRFRPIRDEVEEFIDLWEKIVQ